MSEVARLTHVGGRGGGGGIILKTGQLQHFPAWILDHHKTYLIVIALPTQIEWTEDNLQ